MDSDKVYRSVDRKLSAYEKQIAEQYRIALNQTRAKLADIYEKYAIDGVVTYGTVMKYNRLENLEKELLSVFNSSNTTVVAALKRLPKEVLQEAYKRFAYEFDNGLGVRLTWGALPNAAFENVIDNPLDKIARGNLLVNQKNRIKTALAQGFLQGKSYQAMAKDIKDVYGRTAYEAMRVARTEGQRSAVAAQRAVYDRSVELGIKTNLFWDAFIDSRTRDHHVMMNDVQAKMHEGQQMFLYTPTGQWVTGPMSSALPAGDVINCRCRIREEIEEIPDDIPTGIAKQSYTSWEKGVNI